MATNELERGAFELSQLWDLLGSKLYYVIGDDGVNVANAEVRHFNGEYWLYRDDSDGYSLYEEDEVEDWELTEEQPFLGWDTAGNVIDVRTGKPPIED